MIKVTPQQASVITLCARAIASGMDGNIVRNVIRNVVGSQDDFVNDAIESIIDGSCFVKDGEPYAIARTYLSWAKERYKRKKAMISAQIDQTHCYEKR
jgi:hypothetical protein